MTVKVLVEAVIVHGRTGRSDSEERFLRIIAESTIHQLAVTELSEIPLKTLFRGETNFLGIFRKHILDFDFRTLAFWYKNTVSVICVQVYFAYLINADRGTTKGVGICPVVKKKSAWRYTCCV